VTPFVIVLIVGVVLHTIVGLITRTPEEDHTPFRWKAWHTFITGLLSTALIVAVWVGYAVTTGNTLPFWSLVLSADLITLGWKLWKHRQRVAERRSLQSLFDRPSLGEGA
jgi:uncharacterized BrkB/YihY/UPF0761 family membrane protein